MLELEAIRDSTSYLFFSLIEANYIIKQPLIFHADKPCIYPALSNCPAYDRLKVLLNLPFPIHL